MFEASSFSKVLFYGDNIALYVLHKIYSENSTLLFQFPEPRFTLLLNEDKNMCLRDLVTIDDMYTRMPEKQWLYSSFSKHRCLYIYPAYISQSQ